MGGGGGRRFYRRGGRPPPPVGRGRARALTTAAARRAPRSFARGRSLRPPSCPRPPPPPAVAGIEELARARPLIAACNLTLANAALTGDKRLLFSDAGDAFVMYQIAGRSWVGVCGPVGSPDGAEELVWRLREMSDQHGAQTVFYQVSGERLALYVDLGLGALKIGEEVAFPL